MGGIAFKKLSPRGVECLLFLDSLTFDRPPDIIMIEKGAKDKEIDQGCPEKKPLKYLQGTKP
jgi:hypothetical protein